MDEIVNGLWLGSYDALNTDLLISEGITHVVSAFRALPVTDAKLDKRISQYVIELDDSEEENILQYFPISNKFIRDAIDSGGAVLIHCWAGMSRSATLTAAYLMSSRMIDVEEALTLIRSKRHPCKPLESRIDINPGFLQQLETYYLLRCAEDLDSTPEYARWLFKREVELSALEGRAPEADRIEGIISAMKDVQDDNGFERALRCKICRTMLGNTNVLVQHEPVSMKQHCSHHFMEPVRWMQATLEQGELEGVLKCPKCTQKVGSYAWQGIKCSCGEWVVPGISLARGKVDEMSVKH